MREWINLFEDHHDTNGHHLTYLFHGTSIPAAARILRDNYIEAGDHDDGPHGVSLTREVEVARAFASDVDFRDLENRSLDYREDFYGRPRPGIRGAVLVLNREAMRESFTIVDHQWDGSDSEHEERVKGVINRLDHFLVEVVAREQDILWWIEEKKFEASSYRDDRDRSSILSEIELLGTLLKHPKRGEG